MDRQQIFDYAKKKYKTTPEYLWARCPSYAVLRQSPGFLPGYHMNKKNWLSILLDGTVSDDQILIILMLYLAKQMGISLHGVPSAEAAAPPSASPASPVPDLLSWH